MQRLVITSVLIVLMHQGPVAAQSVPESGTSVETAIQDAPSPFPLKRRMLGYGRLTTNDAIGDRKDRWRSGSITSSRVWGYTWNGSAPSRLGELLELRIQGQIIAPNDLKVADPTDRPYAGVLTFGLHTFASNQGADYSLGLDLAVIGPQTRLDQLQKSLHRLVGGDNLEEGMLAMQIDNQVRPTFVGEIGRKFSVSPQVAIRPFAELRVGDESMARVGADLTFGSVGKGELFSRESITGQRYRVIYNSNPGFSFVVGGDLAYVSDSVYLPEDGGYRVEEWRSRIRAGFHWQGRNASTFYGVTYLSTEFRQQKEGQVTGSIRLKLRF